MNDIHVARFSTGTDSSPRYREKHRIVYRKSEITEVNHDGMLLCYKANSQTFGTGVLFINHIIVKFLFVFGSYNSNISTNTCVDNV